MAESIEDLKDKIVLTDAEKVLLYEQNGAAKMYYALNRKMNEIADLLNDSSLNGIDLEKGKTFDRIFKLLEKSEVISNAAKSLGSIAGVTGNEEEDVAKKPFVDTIAESRK
jgi:hypothetical protein